MSSSRGAPSGSSASSSAPAEDDDADTEESSVDPTLDKASSAARAALSGMTDYHEERELDSSAASRAIESLNSAQSAAQAAAQERAIRLAAVRVSDADIAMIAKELEISEEEAEQKLREHNNDINAIFKSLINMEIKSK
jgi:hypothetical protein